MDMHMCGACIPHTCITTHTTCICTCTAHTHARTHIQTGKGKRKKILCLFKIPMIFFTEVEKNPKICPEKQKTQIAKAVLSRILEVSHFLASNKITEA